MTPHEFIEKWRDAKDEHAVAQSHFHDLCRLLGIEDPQTADPERSWFCFERGARKAGGGSGRADVWRRGCVSGPRGRQGSRPGGVPEMGQA